MDKALTIDKALTAAIGVLQDSRAAVTDAEYCLFVRALSTLTLSCSAICFDALGVEGGRALDFAMSSTDPREGLVRLRQSLSETRESTDSRDGDIDHLRTMQAIWRQNAK